MSGYEVYPEYRDSGVEWLGEVPEEWDIRPVKRLASIFNGATPKAGVEAFWDGTISWVTPADMGKNDSPYIDFGERSITQAGYDSCGTSLCPVDSIVLSSRAPIGKLGIAGREICTNQGCKLLVPKEDIQFKYLYYVLLSSTLRLNLLGRGTTFLELSSEELGSCRISQPPLSEQQKIANFLDHETAKIDTLIEKQQQLIKLLKEKRQAVISHAVTKGLNPDAPMKDSGVEWLGEVPEHWNTVKIKYIVGTTKGVAFKSSDFVKNGIPVVKASDIKNLTVLNDRSVFLPHSYLSMYPEVILEAGDILLSTVGSIPSVANSAVGQIAAVPEVHAGSLLNQNTVIFRLISGDIVKEYFFNCLLSHSYRDHLDIHAHGTANQASLSLEDILNFDIPVPPNEEQTAIFSELEDVRRKFLLTENKAALMINILQERRTALISAAVTGKIDVRNWQPPADISNQSMDA